MNSIKANNEHLDIIQYITYETINAIYPNYYPIEVVDFFLNHHSKENIEKDIRNGNTYLFSIENTYIGTGTIEDNHIGRLFVLPQYQGKGFGSEIMEFLEKEIAKNYNTILLDSSLPGYSLYDKRGYKPIAFHKIETKNHKVLCYHVMEKTLIRNS